MDIIYEDKEKIILKKPAGQLVQSGKNFDLDMVSEVKNYRKQKGEPVYAAVINRLDRPVSGVVLMAKTKESAARYSDIMQKQGFGKQYYAVVYGWLDEKKAVFTDYLKKNKDNIAIISQNDDKEAKRAELDYEVEAEICVSGEKLSLVKINLHTGRFHQIRAQFASRGHGIAGDRKYSDKGRLDDMFLHELGLAPREIALCSHALDIEGDRYSIVPDWWNNLKSVL